MQRKKNAQANQANESKSKMNFLDSVKGGAIQPKLSIGKPNDKFEVEADQMADKVMRMPAQTGSEFGGMNHTQDGAQSSSQGEHSSIQRKCSGCESKEVIAEETEMPSVQRFIEQQSASNPIQRKLDATGLNQGITQQTKDSSLRSMPSITKMRPTVQRKPEDEDTLQKKENQNSGRGPPMGDFSSKLNQSKGSGQPMDSATNSFMSSRFGADFSDVKIHTGGNASSMSDSINAKAFTHQNNVYFNQGQYQPNSNEGKTLLAHELTHTIQQGAVSDGTVMAKLNEEPVHTIQREELESSTFVGPVNIDGPDPFDALADIPDEAEFSAEEQAVYDSLIDTPDAPETDLPAEDGCWDIVTPVNDWAKSAYRTGDYAPEYSNDQSLSEVLFESSSSVLGGPIAMVGAHALYLFDTLPEATRELLLNNAIDQLIEASEKGIEIKPQDKYGYIIQIAFLKKVKDFDIDLKVGIVRKFIAISTGLDLSFLWGFAKGMVSGFVADGILGLIQMVIDVICLIPKMFNFVEMIMEYLGRYSETVSQAIESLHELDQAIKDSVEGAINDIMGMLEEPDRLLEILENLDQYLTDKATEIGERGANALVSAYRLPSHDMGFMVGRIVGVILWEIVFSVIGALATFYIGGVGAGATAGATVVKTGIRAIAKLIAVLTKFIRPILRFIITKIDDLIKFVKAMKRFIPRGVGDKLGKFLGKITEVFDDAIDLIKRKKRRDRGEKDDGDKHFAKWQAFKFQVAAIHEPANKVGKTKLDLASDVAKIKTNVNSGANVIRGIDIDQHKGKWIVKARRKGTLRKRKVGEFWINKNARWRFAKKAIDKEVENIRESRRNVSGIQQEIRGYKEDYGFSSLKVEADTTQGDFDIIGAMSPSNPISEVDGPLPPSKARWGRLSPGNFGMLMTASPLTKNMGQLRGSRPLSSLYNPHWEALRTRMTRPVKGRTWYVRGHLLNHNLWGTGREWKNLAPITDLANRKHLKEVEKPLKSAIRRGKIVEYEVSAPRYPSVNTTLLAAIESANIPEELKTKRKAIVEAERYVPLQFRCAVTTYRKQHDFKNGINGNTWPTVSIDTFTPTANQEDIYVSGQSSMLSDTPVQPKLKIGAPNDKYEQEADQMADRVMRSSGSNEVQRSISHKTIQRACSSCEEESVQRKSWEKEEDYNPYLSKTAPEKVQRKCASCEDETVQRSTTSNDGSFNASSNFQTGLNASKGSGRPMDSNTQSFMENRFGTNFSNVNIHTGSSSEKLNNQINAKAFTTGNNIYFNQGQYAPNSASGKHLLAHELTHTIQQGASGPKVQRTAAQKAWISFRRSVKALEAKYQSGVTHDILLNEVELLKTQANVTEKVVESISIEQMSKKKTKWGVKGTKTGGGKPIILAKIKIDSTSLDLLLENEMTAAIRAIDPAILDLKSIGMVTAKIAIKYGLEPPMTEFVDEISNTHFIIGVKGRSNSFRIRTDNSIWPTGRPNNLIPIKWFKQAVSYPKLKVCNDPSKSLLEGIKTNAPNGNTYLELKTNADNLERAGKDMRLSAPSRKGKDVEKKSVRTRITSATTIKVVRGDTEIQPHEYEIDHVREIIWDGQDNKENLWPVETAVNKAFNANIYQKVKVMKHGFLEVHAVQQFKRLWFHPKKSEQTPASPGDHGTTKKNPVNSGGISGIPTRIQRTPTDQPSCPFLDNREKDTTVGNDIQVCSRPVVGIPLAKHGFVYDPIPPGSGGPYYYAIRGIVPGTGNGVKGCSRKYTNYPDTRDRPATSKCKKCKPKSGKSREELSRCINQRYSAYSDPNVYHNYPDPGERMKWGPNSNSFAAALAACCADSSAAGLGWVPGWRHSPAKACKVDPNSTESEATSDDVKLVDYKGVRPTYGELAKLEFIIWKEENGIHLSQSEKSFWFDKRYEKLINNSKVPNRLTSKKGFPVNGGKRSMTEFLNAITSRKMFELKVGIGLKIEHVGTFITSAKSGGAVKAPNSDWIGLFLNFMSVKQSEIWREKNAIFYKDVKAGFKKIKAEERERMKPLVELSFWDKLSEQKKKKIKKQFFRDYLELCELTHIKRLIGDNSNYFEYLWLIRNTFYLKKKPTLINGKGYLGSRGFYSIDYFDGKKVKHKKEFESSIGEIAEAVAEFSVAVLSMGSKFAVDEIATAIHDCLISIAPKELYCERRINAAYRNVMLDEYVDPEKEAGEKKCDSIADLVLNQIKKKLPKGLRGKVGDLFELKKLIDTGAVDSLLSNASGTASNKLSKDKTNETQRKCKACSVDHIQRSLLSSYKVSSPKPSLVQPKLKNNNTIQRAPKKLPRKDLQIKGAQDIGEQTFNKIYFKENSSSIDFLQELKIATMLMAATPPKELYLYGYSSEEGPKWSNKKLIGLRLNAVKKAIESFGQKGIKINLIARPKESKNSYKYREYRSVEISSAPIAATNGVSNTKDRDCTKTENKAINTSRKSATADVIYALGMVKIYFYAPKSFPQVEALLDLYFGSHSDKVIAHLIKILREMKTDLPKITGNKVRRCANAEHAWCGTAYALADNQTDILFCPKFFNSKEATFKTRILIHEMGHFIPTYLKDYSYAHSRAFRFTNAADSLKNSDAYAMFITDINKRVIKSKKNTLRDSVGDIANGCGKKQNIVESALSWAARWNSLGASGMKQTYTKRVNFNFMKPYLKKEFGKVNKYSLAGIYDRANKLKSVYRGRKFTFNCLTKDNVGCGKTSIVNLNAKGELDVCPAFFLLPANDQIIKMGAEVAKLVPEIQDKYRESYYRIGYDYKKKFWQQ